MHHQHYVKNNINIFSSELILLLSKKLINVTDLHGICKNKFTI